MKQLIDFFKNKNVENLLDIGTGTGDFIKVLEESFPKAKITGIDPNTDSLNQAMEKYPDVIFREMSGEELRIENNSFDAASISMALHHLPDIQQSFSEMKRVVKNGGLIIVNELFRDNLNPAQEVHKLYHHFRSATDRLLGICHSETFKKDEIIRMVEEAGIDIQFHFDFSQEKNLITNSKDLDERVEKIRQMLERVQDFQEYNSLKLKIDKFRELAQKYGFNPATRVVIVGKVLK